MAEDRSVAAVETTLAILSHLYGQSHSGVSEIAEAVGVAPSTAHNHVSTLVDNELVVKVGDRYRLSLWFLRFGTDVQYRTPEYQLAESYVETLEAETGCRSIFMVEEFGLGVFLHTRSGDRSAWNHAREGERERLHLTAAGKAILAHLSDAHREAIIEQRGLGGGTDDSIRDVENLERELHEIRERDVAINEGENIEGIFAIGTPVMDESDQVIGAFSVSGAANRFRDDERREDITATLLGAVNEFELELALSN